jgi:RHS repeat-associated protein
MEATIQKASAIFVALAIGALAQPANSAQVEAAYTIATRYDIAGRVTGIIAPDPDVGGPLRLQATRNTYTGELLTRVESGTLTSFPNETVPVSLWSGYGFNVVLTREFGYDGYGRKTKESVKGLDGTVEAVVQYTYDASSRVLCKAVRMNKTAFVSLPSSACTPSPTGADGPDRISRYTYDGLDQVLTEERAVETSLAQAYVTNVFLPGSRLLQFQTDANGNKTEFQYDGHGRIKKRIFSSTTTVGAVNTNDYNEYGYDENGNLTYERKRSGATISTTFDANNRPTFRNLSNNTYSQDVVYDYDLRGLVLAAHFATEAGSSTGIGITNSFNGFGRLENSTSNVGGFSRTLWYQYDNNGNRRRIQHPDGTYFDYAFDGSNRVSGVFENGSSTPAISVTYRPNGQRWTINRANGATTIYEPDNARRILNFTQDFAGTADDLTNTFSYNPASQLTTLVQSNNLFSYSGNQNREGQYLPNGLNQYITVAGQPVSYDANGNLTSDSTGSTFTYDMENRLVSTASPVSGLKYDPLGRLYELTVVPGSTTQFLYDGSDLVGEYTISGGTTTQTFRYVHGDREDEPWVQYQVNAGNARNYLHADHQGSVIARSDAAANVAARLSYDNYGVPWGGNTGRFGFTGQVWLKELGLFNFKARVYAPKLGRFLQTDPAGTSDQINLYAYVHNNPTNFTDPSGADTKLAGPATPERKAVYDQMVTYMSRSPAFSLRWSALEKSKHTYSVELSTLVKQDEYVAETRTIRVNPRQALLIDGAIQSPAMGFGHEVDHAYRDDQDRAQAKKDNVREPVSVEQTVDSDGMINLIGTFKEAVGEEKAVAAENEMASELGEPGRKYHSDGTPIEVEDVRHSCKPREGHQCPVPKY